MSTLSRFIVGAARLMLVCRDLRRSAVLMGYRNTRGPRLVIARQWFGFERHASAKDRGIAP